MEPSSKDKQIQRSSRRREVNWPRLSSANCLVSWNSSELIWKYLPLNINKTSRRIQSSGRGSKRCVLPLEWIPWQVARDSGQICWILETSTTNLVNFTDFIYILYLNCLCRCTNCGGLHGKSAQNWRIDGAWGD